MLHLPKYPTAIAGLTLGIAGLFVCWSAMVPQAGQLLSSIGAAIAILLISPLLIKFIRHPHLLRDDLQHATVGSTVPTLAMTLMLISHSFGFFSVALASTIWLIAVILHIIFFTTFSYHRIRDFDLHHMVPSWFVPPIGIVVACLTVPAPMFKPLALVLLAFGILAYAVLLPTMIYRLALRTNVEDARKPTLAILAAPASLNLAGYLTLASHPNPILVILLFGIGLLMTATVYMMLLHLIRLPFTPAFSAYTFPLAISATAMFKMSLWAHTSSLFLPYADWFFVVSIIEITAASLVIGYVLQHYLCFIWKEIFLA
tara:strand:+ start:2634 stop:3578 length:945 start_codon:yes stop_codon:yes gene_type:complete